MNGEQEAAGQVSAAFMAVIELAMAHGITAEGMGQNLWKHQVDENWWLALNVTRTPLPHHDGEEMFEVGPRECLITRDGWPVGVIGPAGGTMWAGTEDPFIAAVKAATPKQPPKPAPAATSVERGRELAEQAAAEARKRCWS